MPEPQSHLDDSQELASESIIELFEFTLTDASVLRFSPDIERTWNGNTYEQMPIQLTGLDRAANDKESRPRAVFGNPDGVFSALIASGVLDNAVLTRFRVMKSDAEADNGVHRKQSWICRRVVSLSREGVTLEFRDQLDGQFFLTPGRMFIPPEFPQVSLR